MDNRIAGSILLSAAGLVAAIGAAGAQIAYALVKAGFYVGNMSGQEPPGPDGVAIHWLVYAAVFILVILGVYFFLALPYKKKEK